MWGQRESGTFCARTRPTEHDDWVECSCRDQTRLDGREAHAHAAYRLTRVWTDGHDLTGYVCPDWGPCGCSTSPMES